MATVSIPVLNAPVSSRPSAKMFIDGRLASRLYLSFLNFVFIVKYSFLGLCESVFRGKIKGVVFVLWAGDSVLIKINLMACLHLIDKFRIDFTVPVKATKIKKNPALTGYSFEVIIVKLDMQLCVEKVCALVGGGGYAKKICVSAGHVLPVPPGVSLQDAVCFPEEACTVWSTVSMMSHLSNGETFLIHGGSSWIGTFAIQLAKYYGIKIFITAGREEKLAACKDLGADVCINCNTRGFCFAGEGRNRRKRAANRNQENRALIVSEVEKNVWPAIAAGKVKPVVSVRFH